MYAQPIFYEAPNQFKGKIVSRTILNNSKNSKQLPIRQFKQKA